MYLSDALWTAAQARAEADRRRSVSAVVETALGAYLMTEPAPLPPPAIRPSRRAVQSVETSRCTRCGHPERKHTPRCYVMGCACRAYRDLFQ